MNKIELADALRKIAEEIWHANAQPALLSSLPMELQRRYPGQDYKEALGGQSFKAFIGETASGSGYQLIEHPHQKAKLGLLPAGQEFTFPSASGEPAATAAPIQAGLKGRGSRNVISVLKLLSTLPDSELEKIVIPVSVIAKMFRE